MVKHSMVQLACFSLFFALGLADYDESLCRYATKLSQISYCSNSKIQTWRCTSCRDLPGITDVSSFNKFLPGNQGFTAYDPNRNLILVSFRGSLNIPNWIDNLSFLQTDFEQCEGCKVHSGFQNAYKRLQNDILATTQNLYNKYNTSILVTGHSLGGAMGNFAAIDIYNYISHDILYYVIEQPRVGNQQFATYFNTIVPESYRTAHDRDPVVHLPPNSFGFTHVATEIFYNQPFNSYKICDGSGEDPTCSNQFLFSLNLLDHLFIFNEHTWCNLFLDGSVADLLKLEKEAEQDKFRDYLQKAIKNQEK